MVKKLERAITSMAAILLGLYAGIVLLFSLPVMQTQLADWTASLLSNKFGAKVVIGSINIGFLNRVIINDVTVYEPDGQQMASIARVSASIDMVPLLSQQVVINAAQLFGVNATLYKETPDAKPNFQFIIDALKSDDTDEPSRIQLSINSFIMRRTNISYDVKSEPVKAGALDLNHLALRNCGMNLNLQIIDSDSIDCKVKRLQATEEHSGLRLQNTTLALAASQSCASMGALHIELPHSAIDIAPFRAEYGQLRDKEQFSISETRLTASILPLDLSPLSNRLSILDQEKIDIAATIGGNHKTLCINDIAVNYASFAALRASMSIDALLTDSCMLAAQIDTLSLNMGGITEMEQTANTDSALLHKLAAFGNVKYEGTVSARKISDNTSCEFPYSVESRGSLSTDAGNISYSLDIDTHHKLACHFKADSLDLGSIAGDKDMQKTSFTIKATATLADMNAIRAANIEGLVNSIEYKGYKYRNIRIAATSPSSLLAQVEGNASIDDDNLTATCEFAYSDTDQKQLNVNAEVEKCVPHNLHLTDKYANEVFAVNASADLEGKDWSNTTGTIRAGNLTVSTPDTLYRVKNFSVTAERQGQMSSYTIHSDFADARIYGEVKLADLVPSVTSIIAYYLPQLLPPSSDSCAAHYDYHITLRDCPLLSHLTGMPMAINKPITAHGRVNTEHNALALSLTAPAVHYDDTQYSDVTLFCQSSSLALSTELSAHSCKGNSDAAQKQSSVNIKAGAYNNTVSSTIDWTMHGANDISVHLSPTLAFSDSLGKMKARIELDESRIAVNDTNWTILPATAAIHDKRITCNGLRCVSSNGSSIAVRGTASASPQDSLIAQLSEVEIKYILEAIGFDAVRFAGKASGQATMKGLLGDMQNIALNANLKVKEFTLQEGSLGDADIQARWNKQNESIDLTASFIDHYSTPIELSSATIDHNSGLNGLGSTHMEAVGRTTLKGWVSPSKNDMRLDIMTDNTNAAFIHGFLDGVFTEVSGSLSGPVSVVGMKPVNLIGKAAANIAFRLRATNVPYMLRGDTIQLSEDLIAINNATLYDKYGNTGTLQASISHHNLKNFKYDVRGEMDGLCAYDETQFNSDKFYATVFAKGSIDIAGSDGHPLYINADITPTRGSVFAYDAATPDAIIGNSFIEFQDRGESARPLTAANSDGTEAPRNASHTREQAKSNSYYRNDIYFNANINLTPDCDVKLRMDNIENGYMNTRGYATLNAQWHNKGSFQLFGNYDIQEGSYRLYLQNLIYRDLALQPASSVVFNGNPFDATIHLVCHHTIPSVPLSDLTSTKAFSQNNKVRVNCILDITGYLESMDFKFDMELPNVNDETRQLVRSMINSDEEMNTQMIYLLGFYRFYPSEYARSEGNGNSDQAVNSLLSSTLSGQINQLLSNMIGQDSNWTFGSSLTTGENGWNDLDVEGNVSGSLLNERLLVNGNFGYRDNAMTNQTNFIGDFEVKFKLTDSGNLYVKAYNQANDRYFTKATLNTQGLGISWQFDFDSLLPRRSPLMPGTSLIKSRKKEKEPQKN